MIAASAIAVLAVGQLYKLPTYDTLETHVRERVERAFAFSEYPDAAFAKQFHKRSAGEDDRLDPDRPPTVYTLKRLLHTATRADFAFVIETRAMAWRWPRFEIERGRALRYDLGEIEFGALREPRRGDEVLRALGTLELLDRINDEHWNDPFWPPVLAYGRSCARALYARAARASPLPGKVWFVDQAKLRAQMRAAIEDAVVRHAAARGVPSAKPYPLPKRERVTLKPQTDTAFNVRKYFGTDRYTFDIADVMDLGLVDDPWQPLPSGPIKCVGAYVYGVHVDPADVREPGTGRGPAALRDANGQILTRKHRPYILDRTLEPHGRNFLRFHYGQIGTITGDGNFSTNASHTPNSNKKSRRKTAVRKDTLFLAW